ncbi:MAG: asparaginase [Luteitalea sp.]|nr:asparaginase [Luteitalea sp.]
MVKRITRREFVQTSVVATSSAAVARTTHAAPVLLIPAPTTPVVIASANGNRSKNRRGMTAVQAAFTQLTEGQDVLDALIDGVNIVELDPAVTSVGFGGLPNAEGVVQLDSCCMHGPLRRAGGVAALEGVRTPSRVARVVMQQTDHHLIVGKGAQELARRFGFEIEDDLNTERSRELWLEWKRRTDPDHYLDPEKRAQAGYRATLQMVREGLIDPDHVWGTINCDAVNAKGDIAGVTTTSGLAWKIPGRVGDSPILGAGLYVDNDVGAAGSTGRGEANLYNLCSFLVVELMRAGRHPKDAALEALKRVTANTVEERLLNSHGNPSFQLNFYVLNKKGEYAGVSLYPSKFAVCTEQGPQTLETEFLLPGAPTDG